MVVKKTRGGVDLTLERNFSGCPRAAASSIAPLPQCFGFFLHEKPALNFTLVGVSLNQQACGKAERVILSLMEDPPPPTPRPFTGLLEVSGLLWRRACDLRLRQALATRRAHICLACCKILC